MSATLAYAVLTAGPV